MSELETKLDNLLAEEFGILPAQVTSEFIRDWRQNHLAKDISYEIESNYGGYVMEESQILTREELSAVERKADAFLDRFSDRPAV